VEPFSTSVFKDLTWILATTTKICTRGSYTSLQRESFLATSMSTYSLKRNVFRIALTEKYKYYVWAPSIFRASSLGRYVITHFLADFDFHDHRPAVKMNQHLFWCLD